MYKEAIKGNYRFRSSIGNLEVNDLFRISLDQLNTIAKTISAKIKSAGTEENFISVVSTEDATLAVKLNIVKDVIADKLAEQAVSDAETANAPRIAELIRAKANLQGKATDKMSEKDIEKELAKLRA